MSDWSEISKGFQRWLKENPDISGVKFDENDKDFAPIKYKDAFKLFIAKYDGNEDLNIDSFSKSTKPEDIKKDEKNTLLKDMMSEYVGTLEKGDKVFDAIDGLDGSEKDGKISNKEKALFIEKVAAGSVDFDGKDDNFSFDDLVKSVKKISEGDTEFLNVDVQIPDEAQQVQENAQNPVQNPIVNPQPDTQLPQETPEETLTPVQQVQALNTIVKNWQPKTTIAPNFTASNSGESYKDVSSFSQTTPIIEEIDSATNEKNAYAARYKEAEKPYTEANNYIDENAAMFDEIMQALLQNNDNLQTTYDAITEIDMQIGAKNEQLTAQYEQKDGLSATVGSIESQISSLQGSLDKTPDEDKPAIEEKIRKLKADKDSLENQLAQLAKDILDNKNELDELYTNLNDAYETLKGLELNKDSLSDEQKEVYDATIENRQVVAQMKKEMDSAKAAMVSLDSYIVALKSQLEDIKAQEAEQANQDKEAEEAEEVSETEPEIQLVQNTQDVPVETIGLSGFNVEESTYVEENGKITCTIVDNNGVQRVCTYERDKEGNLVLIKQESSDENGKYQVDYNEDMITYTYSNFTEEITDDSYVLTEKYGDVQIEESDILIKQTASLKIDLKAGESEAYLHLEFNAGENEPKKVSLDESISMNITSENQIEFYKFINSEVQAWDDNATTKTIEFEGHTYILTKTDDGWVLKSKSE